MRCAINEEEECRSNNMRRQRVTLKKRYGLLLTQLLSEFPI
jgi:hypothetical protein